MSFMHFSNIEINICIFLKQNSGGLEIEKKESCILIVIYEKYRSYLYNRKYTPHEKYRLSKRQVAKACHDGYSNNHAINPTMLEMVCMIGIFLNKNVLIKI